LITEHAEVRQAVPAIGEHHREVAHHAPKIMPRPARFQA